MINLSDLSNLFNPLLVPSCKLQLSFKLFQLNHNSTLGAFGTIDKTRRDITELCNTDCTIVCEMSNTHHLLTKG